MFEIFSMEYLQELNLFLLKNDWTEVSVSDFKNTPFLKIVLYKEDDKIIGYLNYSIIYEKAELNQILVDKDYRKQGLGVKLLNYFLYDCKNCDICSLEVREDNVSAIRLYEKFGFKRVANRKNYYGDVDGMLMVYERGE